MAKHNTNWKTDKPSWYDYEVELKSVIFQVRAFRPKNGIGTHPEYWTGHVICRDRKSRQEMFRLSWNSRFSQLEAKPTRQEFADEALARIQAEYTKRCKQYQMA